MDKQLFNDLLESMQEMVAIEKGQEIPETSRVHRHVLPDVKLIRKNAGLKQAEFADAMGVSVDLIRSWEQQRRNPTGPALKMLFLIEQQPLLINALRAI
ncbi:helix-turn-helix domain-containing protein [Pantoea sp. B9002]|uniref:NadS family protein n=1 Tax=Pantoea sp. B9002 TaxID=2726979 RepID=UPI0015A12DA1|nr:NadS family protein [Pantoea sp. B9002]NWA60184.1 helix-turn-helix domain-containing protein [Pantoea sp. B9002]